MADAVTVAVWGHYHGGNLGDELVVATIVDVLRESVPGAHVVGISMDPVEAHERHGIDAYPINPGSTSSRPSPTRPAHPKERRLRTVARRVPGARGARSLAIAARKAILEVPFAWRSYRLLRRLDAVVVAGSGQLLDEWRGPWLHPYTTFRWAMLARLARVPVLFLSMGAGPIETALGAAFIRRAVDAAEYLSVRDRHSGLVLRSIGSEGPLVVCPDIGYGLSESILRIAHSKDASPSDGTTVGVNVMSHQDPRYWPRGDAQRYQAFLHKMAAFTQWLLANGYTVRLFSSQARSDRRVADDLVRVLRESGELDREHFQSAMDSIEQVEDLVEVIRGCDRIVAARYHSVLLPLLLGIPVLGLAYNAKTSELLNDVGRPDRCLDIDEFSVQSLVAAFRDLDRDAEPSARRELSMRVAAHRVAVRRQFEELVDRIRTLGSAPR